MVVLLIALSTDATATAAAPPPVVKVFTFTGEEQTFDVPLGVTSLDVVAVGANGGGGFSFYGGYAPGGLGGVRSGTIPVAPGQRLYVEVGGVGHTPEWGDAGAGGFNGGGLGERATSLSAGGGGGGASDVRAIRRGTPASADSRFIIAAGGGGGGGGWSAQGGPGGDADAAGGSVTSGAGGAVGAGAPEIGADGGYWATTEGGGGGGGGGGIIGGGGGEGGAPAAGGGAGGSSSFSAPVTNRGTTGGTPGEPPRVTITYLVPTADLSAATLTFLEPQPQGTLSPQRTITMSNAGEVPLVVSGFRVTGANPDDFVLSATDCLSGVAPQGTCQMSVRFAPSHPGPRSATLRVATSAGDRELALAGTGTELPQQAQQTAVTPGPTHSGDLVIVAYKARVAGRRVTIHYALTAPAEVTLKAVRPAGRSIVVTRQQGRAGQNKIEADLKPAGKPDRRGTYRFTLVATHGGRSASSAIAVEHAERPRARHQHVAPRSSVSG